MGGGEGGGGDGAVKTKSLSTALTTPAQVMPKAVVGPAWELSMRGTSVVTTMVGVSCMVVSTSTPPVVVTSSVLLTQPRGALKWLETAMA